MRIGNKIKIIVLRFLLGEDYTRIIDSISKIRKIEVLGIIDYLTLTASLNEIELILLCDEEGR